MRCLFMFLILLSFLSPIVRSQDTTQSPDYPQWSDPKYQIANTGKDEGYLTDKEKMVFYYLNLVRMNPKLFSDTYLNHLKNSKDYYESSLYKELKRLKPLPILKPNRKLFESAQCHAIESGKRGYTGHNRRKCKEYFKGECCFYGESDALGIVTSLLIDKSVKSLGHRKICLGMFTELGVAIHPHKTYGENAVLDFQ